MRPLVFNGGTLARKEVYGVQRNALEILKELDTMVGPDDIELLIPSNGVRDFSFKNIRVIGWEGDTTTTIGRTKWLGRQFPQYVRGRGGTGVDLLLALPTRHCDVVAIHDCITEFFPQNATDIKSRISRQLYLRRAKTVLKRCKLVFTVSEKSKSDLINYYHCDPDSITIIYDGWQHMLGVEPDARIVDELGLTAGEYFFSLGSRFAHKNFKWVVEAARHNPQYQFVVTGSSQLNSSDQELNQSPPRNLTFTGYLSDAQIKALMTYCKAFIQPSLYEGFGIPPMEAMSTGTRCIVARAGAMPEIYNKSVWYIDPLDYEHIDLDAIMSEPLEQDNEVILNRYSWKRSAQIVYEALQPFLNER